MSKIKLFLLLCLPVSVLGNGKSNDINIQYTDQTLNLSSLPSYLMLPPGTISIDTFTVYESGLTIDANYNLIVNDTLIIYGNLYLGNNSDLVINDGAVCIIYGNVEVINKIVMNFNSYFIVTGDLIHTGSTENVDLQVEENAAIYILGEVDEHFPTMVCDSSSTANYDPPGDPSLCERGDIISMEDNENNENGLYEWIVSNDTEKGVTPTYSEICESDYVTISVLYAGTGTNYQWRDSTGLALSGETGTSFTTSIAGEYFATFTDSVGTIITTHRAKVVSKTVTFNCVSLTLNSNTAMACQGDNTTNLFYSSTSGGPEKYSIDFDSTAEGAGFTDVIHEALSGGSVTINLPESVVPGTYQAVLTVKNSSTCCVSNNYDITITINSVPDTGEIIID